MASENPDVVAAAMRHYRQGRLGEAAAACRRALGRQPDNLVALQVLAAVRLAERRIDDAIALARRAIAVAPDAPASHNNLGAMLLEAGRPADALASFARALALAPDFVEALNNRGHALNALGRPEEALASLDRAVALKADYASAHCNRGDALRALGRADAALASYERAVAANPRYADALINRGGVLASLGRHQDALASFDRALAAEPGRAAAHFNRGNALRALGRDEEALASYERAVALEPGNADALNNRGNVLRSLGRHDEALASYDRALAADPAYAAAQFGRGNALYALNRMEEAAAGFARAAALDPGDWAAVANRGMALADQGRRGEALDCYRQALALKPDFALARWRHCMHTLPMVPQTEDEAAAARGEFARELGALDSWLAAHPDAGGDLVGSTQPFYLAYREENNRELLGRYGRLCARLLEDWRAKQALPAPAARASGGAIRVGVVSAHFLDHSVWNAIVKAWFQHFDRARIELHGFHLSAKFDFETAWAKLNAASFAAGAKSLRQWADAIAAIRPDVLIYPEIGMDPMAVRLASLRLARVQAASWGHPETTGLPTVDYYLSAEGMEPPHAQDNYTEKLVALPRLGCCYSALAGKGTAPDLAALGIGADAPILLCPGMPFKYAPRHDAALAGIARKLGRCRLVFFIDDKRAALSERLRERLVEAFARAGLDFAAYGVFIPWQNRAAFHGLMKRADAFLDTIGFSGFNTAVQAVECGLPVVAWEGRFMRGRFASAILRRMGLDELVVGTEQAYVDLAARLAADAAYRRETRARIEQSRGVLFEDVATVRALEDFLVEAAGRG